MHFIENTLSDFFNVYNKSVLYTFCTLSHKFSHIVKLLEQLFSLQFTLTFMSFPCKILQTLSCFERYGQIIFSFVCSDVPTWISGNKAKFGHMALEYLRSSCSGCGEEKNQRPAILTHIKADQTKILLNQQTKNIFILEWVLKYLRWKKRAIRMGMGEIWTVRLERRGGGGVAWFFLH